MKKIIDLIKSLFGKSTAAEKAVAIEKVELEIKEEVAELKEKVAEIKKKVVDAAKPAEKKKKKYYPAQPKKVK
jgi:gas vesicle protein